MKTEGLESLLFTPAAPVQYVTRQSPESMMFNGKDGDRRRALKAIDELHMRDEMPHPEGIEINIARALDLSLDFSPLMAEKCRETLKKKAFPIWAARWASYLTPTGERPWEKIWIAMENFPLDADSNRYRAHLMAARLEDPDFRNRMKGRGKTEMESILNRSIAALKSGDGVKIREAYDAAQGFYIRTTTSDREWMMDVLMKHLAPLNWNNQDELAERFSAFIGSTTAEQVRKEDRYMDIAFERASSLD